MTDIVRQCGNIMLKGSSEQILTTEKSSFRDIVTQYDVLIQEFCVNSLSGKFPEAHFICEEADNSSPDPYALTFVIDPIDGTSNFAHHFRHSCTSVACVQDGSPVAAVIYNPFSDELFSAVKGEGAFLNGTSIHVQEQELSRSLVLFGTAPYNMELAEDTISRIRSLYGKCLDLRRSGSAALDLCYVACGRAGLFFEDILSVWDYAAGALIVAEAGGICTALDAKPLVFNQPVKCSVLAGTSKTINEYMNLV